jgi:hypothetical protein
MTVPRINKIFQFFGSDCPSPARAMAAQIGFKPKPKFSTLAQSNEAAMEELMQFIPQRK